MTSPITILGAGAWGTALAMHLARNGSTVCLWDHAPARLAMLQETRLCFDTPLPDNLKITPQFSDALKHSTDIGLVVPSHAFRSVLTEIKSQQKSSNTRLFWGTK